MKEFKIGCNTVWPRTVLASAAVKNFLGGEKAFKYSRKPDIMGDAVHTIVTSDSAKTTGNFFIDDEVMASVGVTDFSKYRMDPNTKEEELLMDFLI